MILQILFSLLIPPPLNTLNLLVRRTSRPLWRPDLEAVFEFPRHLLHAAHSARSSSLPPLGFHAPVIYVCVRLADVGFMREGFGGGWGEIGHTLSDLGCWVAAGGAGVFLDVEGAATWRIIGGSVS